MCKIIKSFPSKIKDIIFPKLKEYGYLNFREYLQYVSIGKKSNGNLGIIVTIPNDIYKCHALNVAQNLDKSRTIETPKYDQLNILCNYEDLKSRIFDDIVKFNGNIIESHGLHDKYIIEYSSPNIAKPFHAGHLRSTLIGNYIANLYALFGHNVKRINYFGDWGTQIGLLLLAFSLKSQEIKDFTLDDMFNAYTYINKLAEQDVSVRTKAKELFMQMEQGNIKLLEQLECLKRISLREYQTLYQTLGVNFDVNEFESMYYKDTTKILNHLEKQDLITSRDGAKIFKTRAGTEVVVEKADGTSLYGVRDVCAALHRISSYKPDHMLYVVENGQHAHFQAVFEMLSYFPKPGIADDRYDRLVHVPFGRISGMQTRKGNVVFVKDILEKCKSLMLQKLKDSPTTRKDLDHEAIAQTLGVSSVVVNVLKQNRLTNYHFDWDKALDFKGNSGNLLQYTHARLCSLERIVTNSSQPEELQVPNFSNLSCNERSQECVDELVIRMMRFQESAQKSFELLEPSIYLNHLFDYCHRINNCYHHLKILNQPDNVVEARLQLFQCARNLLNFSIQFLGLKPLDKM